MVKKNVFGDMLIGVKLKVSQHTLRYCSILGGNTTVKNITCKNIIDIEANCCDWKRLNDQMICALCGKEAIFTSFDARIILEQDLANKIVASKHFGVRMCSEQVDEKKGGGWN